jgi:hypothetical protein
VCARVHRDTKQREGTHSDRIRRRLRSSGKNRGQDANFGSHASLAQVPSQASQAQRLRQRHRPTPRQTQVAPSTTSSASLPWTLLPDSVRRSFGFGAPSCPCQRSSHPLRPRSLGWSAATTAPRWKPHLARAAEATHWQPSGRSLDGPRVPDSPHALGHTGRGPPRAHQPAQLLLTTPPEAGRPCRHPRCSRRSLLHLRRQQIVVSLARRRCHRQRRRRHHQGRVPTLQPA